MPVRRSEPSPKRTTRKTVPAREWAKPICCTCGVVFASMPAWQRHVDTTLHLRCRFPLP